MKSNSSGISHKTTLFAKLLLLFFALILGVLVSLECKTHFLKLQLIETNPDGVLPKAAVWKPVSNAQKHFWPLMVFQKRAYENQIESCYPAECRLSIAGWGKLKLNILPLEPIIKLYWDDKYWYVSEDGKIWQAELPANSIIKLDRVDKAPALFWGEDRVSPYQVGDAGGDIRKSALPVGEITAWYRTLETVKWLDKILAVKTESNEGIPAVRLIFKNRQGQNGVSVLLPENSDNWAVLVLAIKKICPDLSALSQNDFIDGTYKDKILVKNAVQ